MSIAGPIAVEGLTTREALMQRFLAERARWSLWFPVLMGVGIALYFLAEQEPLAWTGPLALVIAVGVLVAAWRAGRDLTGACGFLAVALGFAAAQFQAEMAAAPVLERRLGPVDVVGQLVSVDPLPEGARLTIAPSQIGELDAAHRPVRIRVRLRKGDSPAAPGEWVSLRAMLMPPPAPSMPGAYDFDRRAYFDRLGAVGYALGAATRATAPPGQEPGFWQGAIESMRRGVNARIRAALPGSDGAIAAAILAGQTHGIKPDDSGAFRDAGLAHILVIAGLHMGMVAGIAFFALRAFFALIPRLALNYPIKKFAALGALVVIFGYLLLSGATVSSRRAFMMIGLVLLAILVDRISVSPRAVALAAIVVMLMTPEAATGPSFQMSFSAVGCLVAFYEAMRPTLSAWHRDAGSVRRAGLYVLGLAFTTMVTTVATAPFTIYHFNRFPLYSVAANATAVPITGFWVMPWGIVSVLLMPLGLEKFALVPMSWGIEAIAWIGHQVTSWPGAVMQVPSLDAGALALVSIGGLWLCIWTGRWRWWGMAPIALGFLSLAFIRPPDVLVSGDMKLVMVRSPDGAYLPSVARADPLVQDTWTKRAAAALGAPWPKSGAVGDNLLSCDAEGCLYRVHGQTVALIRDGAALAEDCRAADLVVSPVAAHQACRTTPTIDRIDTLEKGGHAVWLDPSGVSITTVRQWQGARPWSPKRY